MEIVIKSFDELSREELYEILRSRTAVFVVEQECPYQEVDNHDQKALHVIGMKNGELVAYARLFRPGDYADEASIGRVLVVPSHRKRGLARLIMKASLEAVKTRLNSNTAMVSAQRYLEGFYKDLGFHTTGEPYLEDGIPHIKMIRHSI